MKVSAVVLTKNEEKEIFECLSGLKWCDEVVVIDDCSNDTTVELAKKAGAKVIINSLDNDFSKQRNFALSKASNDWILFIDSDERFSTALVAEISNLNSGIFNKYDGFYIRRIDSIWGKELKNGEAGRIKLLRLAKKNSGNWIGKVHEIWEIKGKTSQLKNPIMHYPHKNINDFLKGINTYTDIRAKELYDRKIKINFSLIFFYPFAKFFNNYFVKLGIMDGIPGIIHATMMSFHSFLTRGKLWLMWNKKSSNV